MIKIKIKKTVQITLLSALVISSVSWKGNDETNPTLQVDGLTFSDLNKNGILDKYEDYRLPIADRVQDLLNKLTDEEKTSLLVGMGMPGFDTKTFTFTPGADKGKVAGAAGGTNAIKRLGIPSIIVSDGPAGIRINPTRDNDTNTYYATAFPVGTALASTWNETLINNVGKAMGNEVKEYGVDVLLGPGMNIHRNPLCGRNFEYYSEDPFLTGKIAAAMVNGVQSNGVGTSIKHFAANNQERNRMGINEHISERAMREIYLRAFEITVKEAQPWTIMSSYNSINGTFTSQRKDLLTTILRNEWGFKGIVMTDWFGGYNSFMSPFGPTAVSDVTAQLSAGNDLLMPGMPNQTNAVLENIKNGKISKEAVNKDVTRILELIMKSPAMNNYKYSNKPNLKENAAVTRQAAAEGTVLLKNNSVLPFTSKTTPLAVFGLTSYDFISGGTGSGDVNEAYSVSLIDGLTNSGFSIDTELEKLYKPWAAEQKAKEMARREKEGGLLATPKRLAELELSKEIIANKANSSELAVITIGRNAGEAADRNVDADFNLAPDEVTLIDNVTEAFHAKGKKVVVILNIGGVIETASWKDKVDAILLPWQPGQEGGNSVADVFSGKVNPSGRLTMTFPVKYEDTPSSKNWIGTPADNPTSVTYQEGVYVGYRYFSTFNVKPSYEFGYGLSYTSFDYSDLKLSSKVFTNKITVSVTIKNTGKTAGKEVVELYLSAPSKSIDKPISELKAFGKTNVLQPGESQTIVLTLNAKQLASFITSKKAWITEAGTYKIMVGSSSLNTKKTADFNVVKDIVVEKTNPAFELDEKFADMKH
ncbi:glycoside hydrolase family 3 N-terminal domain-containing protein [Flavobacterium sp. SUN052]|uniref:glycoside hydrolase family 3 N-terminal domain-containing protein n=1 Tax=Flavobacterium sp. SUN052 TaxID=3002441 RepID=UPI00237E4506|nr:glycoside hydrolase family 3 N-terminal domain-containing protein [Flavobacterium sp. SUN052]MEC4005832.1 glycoside hydrolase family 3 N-terminal domain-containing protein [Flavobacterium sp. SUN052]